MIKKQTHGRGHFVVSYFLVCKEGGGHFVSVSNSKFVDFASALK